jgi:hypothetical protein
MDDRHFSYIRKLGKKKLSCLWLNKGHIFILFLALGKCFFARNRDTVVVGRRKEEGRGVLV